MPVERSRITLALLSVLFVGSALADTPGMTSEGDGKASQLTPSIRTFSGEGRPIVPPQVNLGEPGRSFRNDPGLRERAFGSRGRFRSGEEIQEPPGEELLRTLRGRGREDRSLVEPREDAIFGKQEAERSVLGRDGLRRVSNTEDFPFRVIGLIEARIPSGQYGICSAALVGPRTVLTSAYCLFNNDTGWYDEFLFAPGANGFDVLPFGAFEWDSAYIMEGVISEYAGSYESIMIYDLGVLILREPIGEEIGWLGFEPAPDGSTYIVNFAGYPVDRQPPGAMWHSSCEFKVGAPQEYLVEHRCAMSVGTFGSPLYVYEGQGGDRFIHGIQINRYPDAGLALRLTQYDFDWIIQHWQ